MGQQQLLLLVLGIVIVGLAVVVGIQAFGENMKKSNSDALVNDAMRIAADIQSWKIKPKAFGGGADASGFTGVTLSGLGYTVLIAADDGCAIDDFQNLNGCFTLDAATDTDAPTVTAKSLTSGGQGNSIVVTVEGTSSDNITTVVNG